MNQNRFTFFNALKSNASFDIAIIGGGATGLGIALDAATRGLSVVLFESHDFAKGTSSRATKLVHGGVRYLAQGNIALVREALHERTTLLANAPHLAQRLAFVMPSYAWWQSPFYGIGLKIYDRLAGKASLGKTQFLGQFKTQRYLPTIKMQGLVGSVKYWDGQFDDARLALALAKTAILRGALVFNYCAVTSLLHTNGKITGLVVQDQETQQTYSVNARCVVNAAGVWVDQWREQDGQKIKREVKPMVAPSQGVHLVIDYEFLPTDHALLIPKTADGRVLFAVPWLGKIILGTTDTPRQDLAREPLAFEEEIEFILSEAGKVLTRAPQRSDVKSIWVGLRPLVKPPEEDGANTKKLSREHTILISPSGLVTVTGGKWTTYRAMAEDVLSQAMTANLLPLKAGGVTIDLPLVGAMQTNTSLSDPPWLHQYGTEADIVQTLPGAQNELGKAFGKSNITEAMVRFAARFEYARTVEDMLARRSRLLFLDARLARLIAPEVAAILQSETQVDPQLAQFGELAQQYLIA